MTDAKFDDLVLRSMQMLWEDAKRPENMVVGLPTLREYQKAVAESEKELRVFSPAGLRDLFPGLGVTTNKFWRKRV